MSLIAALTRSDILFPYRIVIILLLLLPLLLLVFVVVEPVIYKSQWFWFHTSTLMNIIGEQFTGGVETCVRTLSILIISTNVCL